MDKLNLIDFEKYTPTKDGKIFSHYRQRPLHFTVTKNGYEQVLLFCTDGIQRTYLVHRVIWFYFNGDIPEGIQVNHIDEDKTNNTLSNLNLMSQKENLNWGTRNERISASKVGKPRSEKLKTSLKKIKTKHHVLQYNLETGEPIRLWLNTHEIGRVLGYNQSFIFNCCKGGHFNNGKWQNNNKAYGYGWKFAN
jgi:hypothetical protein